MGKVTIVDSICGSGKSTFFFNKMNTEKEKRFIYITPYLDEIQRCIDTCSDRHFTQPKNLGKGKLDNLNKLLKEGKNIASTHALFRLCNEETLKCLNEMNYTLILDEVMDVVELMTVTKKDLQGMFNNKYIEVDENTKKIKWIDKEYKGKFDVIKSEIECGDVYLVRDRLMIWTFPVSVFNAISESFILSYLFEGQLQRYYYDMHKIKYDYKSIKNIDGKYVISEYHEIENMDYIKKCINVYDGKMNNIGEYDDNKNPLSVTWFKSNYGDKTDALDVLKRNMTNYFQKICKTSSDVNMWTVFKEYKGKCKGKGYTKGFVSCNCRATNVYSNKKSLAYCINIFNNPMIIGFFKDNGVVVNQDKFALSELIQWMFRSSLRNGENIDMYIPSERMRSLLLRWLNSEKI